MTRNSKTELEALEACLEELRAKPAPDVPQDLVERVLSDARALQPALARPVVQAGPGWRGWVRQIGGWPALGGLVVAGSAGFWIGISPPLDAADPARWVLPLAAEGWGEAAELTGFGWETGLEEG